MGGVERRSDSDVGYFPTGNVYEAGNFLIGDGHFELFLNRLAAVAGSLADEESI